MHIELDTKAFDEIMDKFSDRDNAKFIKNSINDLLFNVRNFAIKDKKGMSSEFTIRNKSLVRKHLRVKKAFGVAGYFGSVASTRFSGWAEQQHGTPTKRKIKIHTKHARGPSGKRKLAGKYRRNAKHINLLKAKIGNATGSYRQMITANLAMLRRTRESGPVLLPIKYGNMKPGIYNLLKSGKMKIQEIFEEQQPERNQWANDIVLRYFATGRYKKVIEDNIKKAIGK